MTNTSGGSEPRSYPLRIDHRKSPGPEEVSSISVYPSTYQFVYVPFKSIYLFVCPSNDLSYLPLHMYTHIYIYNYR